MSDPKAPTLRHYSEIEWDRPLETSAPGAAPPEELVRQAEKVGARRKKLVEGDAGFFMNRSLLPANYRVPPHQHNHNEMLVVLSGGCEFDGDLGRLGPDDTIVIHAKTRYGFTCGADGMDFLTIRLGEATTSLEG